MHFLVPMMLLWAVPVVAAVVALYLFRLRRQDRRVPSLMLWGRALREMQANAPFRRLRFNWLMVLQILAAIALVLALARPFRTVPGVSGRCLAVVIDASASMRATDVRPSRLDHAKAEAARLVDGLGRGDDMCLVVAGAPTRVAAPLTSDKSALRAALDSIAATDCPARADEAARLALSLIRGRSGGRVVVLSDGGFPDLSVAGDVSAITFIRIGQGDNNVGIMALDSRPGPQGRPLLLATMRNFSRAKRDCGLELRADGKLVDVQQFSLAAGQEVSRVFAATGGAQRIDARLDIEDALAADNEAHLLLGAGKQASGVLLTRGNFFLQRALAIDPTAAFVRAAVPEALSLRPSDIYVLDRLSPAQLPAHADVMFVGIANAQAPVEVVGTVDKPQVTGWDRDHPITRWVDFSDLSIARAQKVAPRSWGKPLVYARDAPLVVAGERDGARAIYIAWDLVDSDFVLRVGFPIFIGNCLRWLVGDRGAVPTANLRTGEVFALSPGVARGNVDVVLPGGDRTALPVRDAMAALRLERVGVYEARVGKYRAVAAANLFDARESDIAPRDALVIGGKQVASVSHRPRRTEEYWRWAALLVLGLLTIEWLAYHRRI